ncbi:putative nucleotidyltransferase substrate binding domain-containing protein [Pseudomonas sp. CCI1.2]|uniref:putative nucleotidyltransferase substrate binding domain-containing protein n=1 Tax=unclassified Pseudomonas TaxID=196821 RepID=UPI002AC8FFB2|nr:MULTISPECIES: putative nucleotidyltransferase substrate binding domain-containing protein [unclassified Pseudomonas]MEB0092046.1 putative nucleotidyltransferase substrate binding domain-containing protein [Pseudomonas sp. CCI4.2]MEB0123608.1 putative nucleotidyltransferase substrate binding domain-containing protein [Pseudomonas sp. CCI1.2]WPX55510.1 putative nucleotidyltransferase substrate binding domain-containing protein [Pseudomonas sp. CCI4.2]
MRKADAFNQAGKTAVLQNIHGTIQFLQKFPPFNQMENAHLAYLVEQCQLRFYAADECIIKPADGPVEHFYIVKTGRVVGERTHPAKSETETTFEISTGECFPLAALLGERATRTEHLAAEDTFCLQLNKLAFIKLFALSSEFRDFALRGVSSLLEQVNQQVQQRAAEALGTQYSLNTRLGELAMRHPVTCSPDTPLREAVKLMHEQQVGSIVIVDERKAPLGIFTLRDLRQVVADGTGDFGLPIEKNMIQKPFFLSPDASAFDAAIAMTERHIAHVCLVKDQRLCGVVSERDLFSLQRVDLVHLARTIRSATKIESLANLRGEIVQLVDRMLAHGASSTQITQIITLLNDHTVCRVIELTVLEKGDPGIPFSWLCFGSEGRREQTLYTDQDNGILFEANDAAEAAAIRAKLLPLAQQINQSLAQCGFTLCKGNIMAGNPDLCLSRLEWSRRFAAFIREATPENLLASSIYFDLRVVWGDERSVDQLRRGILDQVADNRLFQRMMADNALRQRPPVGRFRDFVLARKGGEKATLDLKVQGLTPFVDGARLLALANGVEANNTLERLRQLVDKEVIEPLDGAAYEEAYHFIQQTRMQQHQLQSRQNLPYSNRVDPDILNHLDRRILRESLRQAQRLQSSLTLRYQL